MRRGVDILGWTRKQKKGDVVKLKIDPDEIGTKIVIFPFSQVAIVWLLLDRLHPSETVVAVAWTITGFLCLARMIQPFQEKWVRLLNRDKD